MTPILQLRLTRKAAVAATLAGGLTLTVLVRLVWQEAVYYFPTPSAGATAPAIRATLRPPGILSPLAFVQHTNSVAALTNMPFNAAPVEKYLATLAAEEAAAEAARQAALEEQRRAAAERAAQQAREQGAARALAEAAARQATLLKATTPSGASRAGPTRPPPMVRFAYQGLFRMAGEKTLALICVETNNGTYAIGEFCRGALVTGISADAVSLTLADGSVRQVESGRPELIEKDDLHAQRP